MIEIHPLEQSQTADFLKEYGISADCAVLAASENGGAVGFAAILQNKDELEILGLKWQDDEVCELLLRAAASYGERREIERLTLRAPAPERVVKIMGFCPENEKMSLNIENVVHIRKNQ